MTLYSSTVNPLPSTLLRVDPQSAAVLSNTGVAMVSGVRSKYLAVDPITSNLYAIQNNDILYLVNQTSGVAGSAIGSANTEINGMTFLGSELYVMRLPGVGTFLGKIDTGTGSYTQIAQFPTSIMSGSASRCLAASPFGILHVLVKTSSAQNILYIVDPSTAVCTEEINLNGLYPSVPTFVNMAFDSVGRLFLTTFATLTAIQKSSLGWQIVVPTVNYSPSATYSALAFFPPACIHHSSLIELMDGNLVRISNIQPGMMIRQGDGGIAEVEALVECDLKEKTSDDKDHLCLVFEPHSLGPNLPNARFVVDPGHPISIPSAYAKEGPHALRCARAFATELSSSQVKLCTWTNVHEILSETEIPRRFDIILKDGRSTYLANGIAVMSRTSLRKPGYDHAGGLF